MTWESSALRASVVVSESPARSQCLKTYQNRIAGFGTFGIVDKRAVDVQLNLILIVVRREVLHIDVICAEVAVAAQQDWPWSKVSMVKRNHKA